MHVSPTDAGAAGYAAGGGGYGAGARLQQAGGMDGLMTVMGGPSASATAVGMYGVGEPVVHGGRRYKGKGASARTGAQRDI